MQNKFCPFSPGYQYDNRSATDPIGYFTKLGIAFVSYSTLSGWPLHNSGAISPKDDPHVAAIATRLRRTPTQVLLRWALQHGAAVIPTSRTHAADNAAVFNFVLDEAHMATISGLSWFFATAKRATVCRRPRCAGGSHVVGAASRMERLERQDLHSLLAVRRPYKSLKK